MQWYCIFISERVVETALIWGVWADVRSLKAKPLHPHGWLDPSGPAQVFWTSYFVLLNFSFLTYKISAFSVWDFMRLKKVKKKNPKNFFLAPDNYSKNSKLILSSNSTPFCEFFPNLKKLRGSFFSIPLLSIILYHCNFQQVYLYISGSQPGAILSLGDSLQYLETLLIVRARVRRVAVHI